MGYRLKADEAVESGVRRIAREQIDKALAEIDDDGLGAHRTVHRVRKRCKKVRGLVRLVRPAFEDYSSANSCFRDAARRLAPARDSHTMLRTAERLADRVEGLDCAGLLGLLRRRRDEAAARVLGSELARCREELLECRDVVSGWRVEGDGIEAVLGGVLKTYKRGRARFRDAREESGVELLHEWRKRTKYLRYHARLLSGAWDPVLSAYRDEAKRLSDILGEDHDLGVLRAWIADLDHDEVSPRSAEGLMAAIDARRQKLHARAWPVGARVFAVKPRTVGDCLGRVWNAWQAERGIRVVLQDAG